MCLSLREFLVHLDICIFGLTDGYSAKFWNSIALGPLYRPCEFQILTRKGESCIEFYLSLTCIYHYENFWNTKTFVSLDWPMKNSTKFWNLIELGPLYRPCEL